MANLVGLVKVRAAARKDFKGVWTPHRFWGTDDTCAKVYDSDEDPFLTGEVRNGYAVPAVGPDGVCCIGQRTLKQLGEMESVSTRFISLPLVTGTTDEELAAAQATQDEALARAMSPDFDPIQEATAQLSSIQAQAASIIAAAKAEAARIVASAKEAQI